MKKIVILIMTVAFAMALCACGAKEQASSMSGADFPVMSGSGMEPAQPTSDSGKKSVYAESLEKASAYVESIIDVQSMDVFYDDTDPEYQGCTWINNEESENKELVKEISIDGFMVKLGDTREKEVEEAGFTVDKVSDSLEPNEILSITVNKGDRFVGLTLRENRSDEVQAVSDCILTGLTIGAKDYAIPFDYNGFTPESTLEDVLSLFGTPNDSIKISSDAVGTIISLTYHHMTESDSPQNVEILGIDFMYDEAANTTSYFGMQLNCDTE